MNKLITLLIALLIVAILLRGFELYTIPRTLTLDTEWNRTLPLDTEWNKVLNHPKRVSDTFNTCSPESYKDCSLKAFPNLSRY